METLTLAGFIVAVLALGVALMTAPVVAYIVYRYVWVPWAVMRKDLAALSGKVSALEAGANQARVMGRSDEDTARIEARMNARQRARVSAMDEPRG